MVRRGRWKSGLALLLFLHLLVHPAIHIHRSPELLTSATHHSLIREEGSDPDDVCSLCRVANALYGPGSAPAQGKILLEVDIQRVETVAAARTVERFQRIPRAPPASLYL
jgi:hypothetical protein